MFHAGSEVCLSSVFSFSLCKQIIPQSVCSRYGLAIGAAVAPFVRVLVFICYPVAYPISKVTYAEHIMCLCQQYVVNYYSSFLTVYVLCTFPAIRLSARTWACRSFSQS